VTTPELPAGHRDNFHTIRLQRKVLWSFHYTTFLSTVQT
jgi:hypothetical protein